MVLLGTSEEWQQQTSLLLEARPTTTRITTKYNIPNLDSPKYQQKLKKRKRDANGEDKDGTNATPLVPRATLTLKAYDPESGVVLKFKTDRAAEVGRLVNGLGRVGRQMAALPEKEETQDSKMEDVVGAEGTTEIAAQTSASAASGAKPQSQPQQAGGGGKKKKKNKK
ncbi:uncharacterized protein SEPMUDRAFT_147396 [Sphaerulina musiva SO2202]|uniref:SRP9 domain-containing protein n=1 Tax=Sphaerulina musiva (strain SO2202) TaxID=692275 RepID=M3CP32_SPHMS|nr:uncharacterized protein SEPMUDRAFT_147396 [Sphaerulina musiva SO2202]EMF15538.1 hypothetical protein SEPMUDRAFT_147396 [Sphaerulina musiva SO2202]